MFDVSYQKSSSVRNIVAILFILALLFVAYKITMSIEKVKLYNMAKAHYQQNNLVLAEDFFSQAEAIQVISYNDEFAPSLAELSPLRENVQFLAVQADEAYAKGDLALLLKTYHSYQDTLKKHQTGNSAQASFFKALSNRYEIEKKLSTYFLNEKQRFLDQMKNNLTSRNFENEPFIHGLTAIPDQFFGGGKKKKQEVVSLLQKYEQAKWNYIEKNSNFTEAIRLAHKSLLQYQQESVTADWLSDLVEDYGINNLQRDLKSNDITTFIEHAKQFEKLKNDLPTNSKVFTLIDQNISDLFQEAERYAGGGQYERAIELYKKLDVYKDTDTVIAHTEDVWEKNAPLRILQKKFPEKEFRVVSSGSNQWGSLVYVAAVSSQNELYYAAKMPDNTTLLLENKLDSDLPAIGIVLSDSVTDQKVPIIIIQTSSNQRKSTYYGFEIANTELKKRFQIEADMFSVEQPGLFVIENPVGDGQNEVAYFKLGEDNLVYDSAKEEFIPDETASTPEDVTVEMPAESNDNQYVNPLFIETPTDIYAGPHIEHRIIGRISAGETVEYLQQSEEWSQIRVDGIEGWIYRPLANE